MHAFPGIGGVVHAFATQLGQNHPVQVRSLTPPFGKTDAPLKRLAIQALARLGGAGRWKELAFNTAFGGDYSLRAGADYACLFASWLAAAPDGALVMCHPDLDPGHDGATAGQREHEFLLSPRCPSLFAGVGASLATRSDRFPRERRLTGRHTGTQ